MQSNSALIRKLKKCLGVISEVIESLESDSVREDGQQYASHAGEICPMCGKPIELSDKTTRGSLHTSCYNKFFKKFVGPGNKFPTIDDAEAAGVIPPKQKPGRKSESISDEAIGRIKQRIKRNQEKRD